MIESIEESVTSIEALLVEEAPAHVIALLTVEMASRDGRLSPDMRKGMCAIFSSSWRTRNSTARRLSASVFEGSFGTVNSFNWQTSCLLFLTAC